MADGTRTTTKRQARGPRAAATAGAGKGRGAAGALLGVPAMPLKPRPAIPALAPEERASLDAVMARYGNDPASVLAMLQDINDLHNYLPRHWLEELAARLKIPRTRLYRVATFFRALSLEPRGRHICTVCIGTTCHVRGAPKLIDKVERDLGIKAGETTADMQMTLETVGCVGACALGPLVVLDGKYHGHMTPEKLGKVLKKTPEEGKDN